MDSAKALDRRRAPRLDFPSESAELSRLVVT